MIGPEYGGVKDEQSIAVPDVLVLSNQQELEEFDTFLDILGPSLLQTPFLRLHCTLPRRVRRAWL